MRRTYRNCGAMVMKASLTTVGLPGLRFSAEEIELPDTAGISDVLGFLSREDPEMSGSIAIAQVFVNGTQITESDVSLPENCDILVVMPVAGG